jgi:hypothetical protein
MQFSPVSCSFIPLRSILSPKHPVVNLSSPPNVKYHVSYPYETKGKIILFLFYYLHLSSSYTHKQFLEG